jgi:hypothetical protein
LICCKLRVGTNSSPSSPPCHTRTIFTSPKSDGKHECVEVTSQWLTPEENDPTQYWSSNLSEDNGNVNYAQYFPHMNHTPYPGHYQHYQQYQNWPNYDNYGYGYAYNADTTWTNASNDTTTRDEEQEEESYRVSVDEKSVALEDDPKLEEEVRRPFYVLIFELDTNLSEDFFSKHFQEMIEESCSFQPKLSFLLRMTFKGSFTYVGNKLKKRILKSN